MSESQFNYVFTTKNALLTSNKLQIVINLELNEIFKCNLLYTWPKFSSVNDINLVKKICYNSGDMEFFLGDCFLLAHPVYIRSH